MLQQTFEALLYSRKTSQKSQYNLINLNYVVMHKNYYLYETFERGCQLRKT